MNTFSFHDTGKNNHRLRSAIIVVFPLDRTHRHATPTLDKPTVPARKELRCSVVLMRRGQAAENVNRLLHLRVLQEAVFALKRSDEILPKSAPQGRTGPRPF